MIHDLYREVNMLASTVISVLVVLLLVGLIVLAREAITALQTWTSNNRTRVP